MQHRYTQPSAIRKNDLIDAAAREVLEESIDPTRATVTVHHVRAQNDSGWFGQSDPSRHPELPFTRFTPQELERVIARARAKGARLDGVERE